MGDYLIMNKKERDRKTLLEAYRHEKLSLLECAHRLGTSYRQMKRIWGFYSRYGDDGLCHKNRGRQPHNAYSASFKTKVIELYQLNYLGFGPTFACEKLAEDDGIIVNPETLRLWLKQQGIWSKKRKRMIYRERRERRACFGELLQIDGSIHQWFSDDRYDCLLNMVDDATGTTLALLDTGETTDILLSCLKQWIEKYGIPKAVYVDLKNVYVGSKKLKSPDDTDLNSEGFSVFEQVCKRLGIDIIKAYSPQAKGRVERKHGVFQDRLVKSLKLYGIKTIEAANAYLTNTFLLTINKKFAKTPKDLTDAHRDWKPYGDLDQVICWNYERQLKNNWSVQLKNEHYQIREPAKSVVLQPGKKVLIKKHLNGEFSFWYADKRLEHGELSRKPEPISRSKKYYALKGPINPLKRGQISRRNKHKSPWGQYSHWISKRKPEDKTAGYADV